MHFDGSVIKEQGVTFGIVVVKQHIMSIPSERSNMIAFGKRAFGLMPIILMSQDSRGRAKYYGRRDIVDFLANVPFHSIPWKRYTI